MIIFILINKNNIKIRQHKYKVKIKYKWTRRRDFCKKIAKNYSPPQKTKSKKHIFL